MNTPLLLTSVALLAGVAARPIQNDRRGDDLRDLIRSPNADDRQAFLGRIHSGFDSPNSLQLHDLHDSTHSGGGDEPNGSKSPKLISADDSSNPDPGLASPYMGPQPQLTIIDAIIDQELGSPKLQPGTPAPSSPAPRQNEQLHGVMEEPDYSPMVVILVISSLAALVLLGLTVAVVYTTQLLRRTVLQEDVWRTVTGGRCREKGDVKWSEKEKVGQPDMGSSLLEGGKNQEIIAAREVPCERLPPPALDSAKPSSEDDLVEDPDVMPLPKKPASPSAPAVRGQNAERNMGLALMGWTYDNWVTHFMMALFGWLGVFLGGAREGR